MSQFKLKLNVVIFLPGQDEEAEGIFTRKHELKDQVLKALEVLTNREREVLEMRFGLKDGLSHTREEVGPSFQVHRRTNPAN